MTDNESPEEEGQDDHLTNLRNILSPEILSRASALPISPTNNPLQAANVRVLLPS